MSHPSSGGYLWYHHWPLNMSSNLVTSVPDQATDRSTFTDQTPMLKSRFTAWCFWLAYHWWWPSYDVHLLTDWVDDVFSTLMSPEYGCLLGVRPLCLNNFVLGKWSGCLTMWITDARRAVLKKTHLSGCVGIETTPITIVSRCFTDYKYLLHFALIAILHFFTFLCKVFLSLSWLKNNGR
jgi:hypothetical protein